MIKHIKRLWGHYLALLIISIILFFPISRVYHFFWVSFGYEAALISLAITTMIVMIFGIRGAVHTHRIIRTLRREIPHAESSDTRQKMYISALLWVFKIRRSEENRARKEVNRHSDDGDLALPPFTLFPKKRRGKRPRFPEEKIRRAVLKWENRDPVFSVATLEEFLAQEFGSSPDGILMMAPTTFYDWRRRILEEMKSRVHK